MTTTTDTDNITDILDSLPMQETPIELVEWAKRVFIICEKYGYKDNDVMEWISAHARRKGFSKQQIDKAILNAMSMIEIDKR